VHFCGGQTERREQAKSSKAESSFSFFLEPAVRHVGAWWPVQEREQLREQVRLIGVAEADLLDVRQVDGTQRAQQQAGAAMQGVVALGVALGAVFVLIARTRT
jgi:hypothetical protein